jgi:branched-chain amino acid transport system substrate-binding protein
MRNRKRHEVITSTENRTNRRRFLKASAVSVGLAGIAGCTQSGENDDGDGTPTDGGTGRQNGTPSVKLGVLAALSGPYSNYGDHMVNGVNMAADRSNVDVEFVIRDSGTSPDVSVPVANELISQHNVDFLLGNTSSAAGLAVQQIADREGIFYLPQCSTKRLTGENCSRFGFQHMMNTYEFGAAAVQAYQDGLFENLFMLVADYEGGQQIADETVALIEGAGGNIASRRAVPFGNDDFSASISKINDSGADAVYYSAGSGDIISFISQAESAGLGIDYHIPVLDLDVAGGIPASGLARLYGGSVYYLKGISDSADEWGTDYENAFGIRPRYHSATSFESSLELFNAVERTGTKDTEEIISAFEDHEFEGVTGETHQWRGCDHVSLKTVYLLEGKAEDEKDGANDVARVSGSLNSEDIIPSCSNRSCSR